jgi:3'-phosphoadenosine 5'-phosphosulfate sulfotransferase (PAPS reductase)/FAD synthetase
MSVEQLYLFDTDHQERDEEDLLASALAVIDAAFETGAHEMLPLFSGGHDSLSACFVAAQHPRFAGEVHHIDTGIGAHATRSFVETVCREYGWTLTVWKSNFSYERYIRRLGFPGPGSHQWVYNKLKERCVSKMGKGRGPVVLLTGCRRQESTRRMGSVQPVKVGEISKKTGKVTRKNRIWTAPCYDWSSDEQRRFMDAFALPRNPIKFSPLGMSGECFCGSFARPNELELIRHVAPDVAAEIERLTEIAKECGTHACWGTRPDRRRGLVVTQTGPLCSSCDLRAAAAGLLFEGIEGENDH